MSVGREVRPDLRHGPERLQASGARRERQHCRAPRGDKQLPLLPAARGSQGKSRFNQSTSWQTHQGYIGCQSSARGAIFNLKRDIPAVSTTIICQLWFANLFDFMWRTPQTRVQYCDILLLRLYFTMLIGRNSSVSIERVGQTHEYSWGACLFINLS